MRRCFIVVACFFALSLTGQTVWAQVGEEVDIDPALCIVEPRTVESLIPLLPTGTPAPRTPAEEFVTPEGEPVDAETAEAVAEFVYQTSACLLTGNMLAVFALQTDAYTSATFGRMGLTEDQLAGFAQSGDGNGSRSMVKINDMAVLDDGRIGVSVTEMQSMSGMPQVFELYYFLVAHEDSYLMDDYVLISAS